MSHLIRCFCLVFVVATLATSSRFMLHVICCSCLVFAKKNSVNFVL
jgi:hypothetical protein